MGRLGQSDAAPSLERAEIWLSSASTLCETGNHAAERRPSDFITEGRPAIQAGFSYKLVF